MTNNLQYAGFFGKMLKEDNPQWPPHTGKIVVVHNPSYKELFIGNVVENIWNGTSSVISLLNNKNYVEKALVSQKIVNKNTGGKGLFLLLPIYAWKYADKDIMDQIIKASNPELIDQVNSNVQMQYDNFMKTFNNPNKSAGPGVNQQNEIVALDLETGEQIKPPVNQENITENIYETDESEPIAELRNNGCSSEDNFKDTSLLTEKGELDMNDLFREKDVNAILYDPNETFTHISSDAKAMLLEKLRNPQTIPEEDQQIVVNKTAAIRNMITSKEDEKNEGKKIVGWLKHKIVHHKSGVFTDLKVSIFAGYVHIARTGLKVDDIITSALIPNLNYFKWQYNIPIDYATLKYILFQNRFQKSIARDRDEQIEAEKILSKEYLICLQPEPKYQLWTLKRLLMAWYADIDLQHNIRKIKVLINQWRARGDQSVNKQYGVMPSIVIYPRYGKKSARVVLSRIAEYFLLYQNVAWSCSKPSYFIKINDLVWYTNGAIDLKLYFRKTKNAYNNAIKNDTFDSSYNIIKGAKEILYPYKIA
jgi:hypothetical protein